MLDDSLKTLEEVEAQFKEPVLGSIGKIPKGNAMDFIAYEPCSAIAYEFLLLRTNLEFFIVDKSKTTILVTSLGIPEGKLMVAINLTLNHAQTEKKAVLVDTDFRRSNLHTEVGVANAHGLSDICPGLARLTEVLVRRNNG